MADFIELVPHVDDGFLRLQDAAQVDRRATEDEVAGGRVDRLLELLDLLRAVSHRGQDLAGVRVLLVRFLDRSDRVIHGADDLGRAEPLRRNVRRAVLHAAMGQRRPVLDREDLLAADLYAVVRSDRGGRLDDDGIGIHAPDVLLHDLDVLRRRGVDLVDHDDVRHPDVRLARIVRELVARTQRVRDDDVKVRLDERGVVVPAIPQEDLGLGFGLTQDLLVVDARVDDGPLVDVGLVFLPLFDRRLVFVQVLVRGEALDRLGRQVAVRHRMADHDDLLAVGPQNPGDPARRLALPASGADRAYRDDGHLRLQHRFFGAEEEEFRPVRVREGDSMPDVRVVDVGVSEDARLRTEPLDEPRELFFRKNRDPFGIQVPREGRGILPSLDPGDLRGGERHDAIRRIVPEINVEIMEVAARGAEDDYVARLRHGLGSRRGCKAFLDFSASSGMLTLNKVNSQCLWSYRAWSVERTVCTDSKTRSNIDCVRRPVCVFRWL